MSAEAVNFFFQMREQLKLYHWQTHSYARHKATDELLDSLDKLIDEYVEVYMGKYGRPRIGGKTATLRLTNMNEKQAGRFVKACVAYLTGPLTRDLKEGDSDLMNLRDEMLAHLHRVMYLFSLD
jgi:hypothetical protein